MNFFFLRTTGHQRSEEQSNEKPFFIFSKTPLLVCFIVPRLHIAEHVLLPSSVSADARVWGPVPCHRVAVRPWARCLPKFLFLSLYSMDMGDACSL